MQKLFAARIRTVYRAESGQRVGAIPLVYENDPRLGVEPSVLDELVENFFDGDIYFFGADYRTVRSAENVMRFRFLSFPFAEPMFVRALDELSHKLVGDFYRDVKIPYASFYFFTADKIQNIRMRHFHHRHIGAMPPLLFDCPESVVVNFKKSDRTGRNSAGFFCRRHSWTQMRKIKP